MGAEICRPPVDGTPPVRTPPEFPFDGVLHLDGWAGRSRQAVRVVGETPTRYRVEVHPVHGLEGRVRLGGRDRYLVPGERRLVPKRSITWHDAAEVVAAGGHARGPRAGGAS